ncbi:Uncharacterised protein [uncultured Clostridium sp.]|nr:Uncharacterised protein [uncultured Clostridium sp.]SCJ21007.1 Uncharacterised protein [uncultured Clostridium sp.]
MSRVERKLEEKNKKKARKAIYRFIFLIVMTFIISICAFLIDKEATLMIGEVKEYNIEVFINNFGNSVMDTIKDIERKLSKLNNLK